MQGSIPTPVDTELRFAWRVDYFATREDAQTFLDSRTTAVTRTVWDGTGDRAGLFGVHWCDRPGEGWYG